VRAVFAEKWSFLPSSGPTKGFWRQRVFDRTFNRLKSPQSCQNHLVAKKATPGLRLVQREFTLGKKESKMKAASLVAIVLFAITGPLAGARELPQLQCNVSMNFPNGESLDQNYEGSRVDNKLEINAGAALKTAIVDIRIDANLETNRLNIYIFNTRTSKRYLVFQGVYTSGEVIFAGVDHGPVNGMDNVDVTCTVN
jgi:hypothetical protein